ncbi:MAG: hypothetical protein V1754_04705 [Pseudomonadota bacterium]
MRVGSIFGVVLCLFLISKNAAADPTQGSSPSADTILSGGQGAPTPPANALGTSPVLDFSGEAGGDVLFEEIHGDYFLSVDLFAKIFFGPIKLGVCAPLRFRVLDYGTDDDSVVRKEDWDEISDYARIVRFFEIVLSEEAWRFRSRVGVLEGESLGHGTMVAGYYNTLDVNHFQAGFVLNTAIEYGGVEFMLDNLMDPEIFGLRLHVRPMSFIADNLWANRLVVGFSYVADTNAPVALSDRIPDNHQFDPEIDGDKNLRYAGNDILSVLGVDFEYTILQNQLFDLVPYLDVNFLVDRDGLGTGAGVHLGTFFNFRIPTPVGPMLLTRLEYRYVGSGYAPRYIDALYDVQRVQYDPTAVIGKGENIPLTKLGWLRASGANPAHGWLGELYLDFAGWVRVGGTYEDYEGPNNAALTLGLIFQKLSIIKAGAYYARRGFDGFGDAFDLDGGLLLLFVGADVYGPIHATVTYSRTWHLDDDGSYLATGEWNIGVGVSFSF